MMMEKLVEWLAGETEVLGENLPQYRFVGIADIATGYRLDGQGHHFFYC
jgi:hypothetical protein